MKIYTKTGDKGETSLIGGKRVPKYHPRIEVYGTLDELNSFIGLLYEKVNDAQSKDTLLKIMNQIFAIESIVATEPPTSDSFVLPDIPAITNTQVEFLENQIDCLNKHLNPLSSFLLPAGSEAVALCHICRTITRRCERLLLKLNTEKAIDEAIIKYINRLSDFFFILARYQCKITNSNEFIWNKEQI